MKRKRAGSYWVYMVRCARGTYYTGCARCLGKRLSQHNAGTGAKYLRGRNPVRLVYSRACPNYSKALIAEGKIKKLTRAHKEGLIRIYEKSKKDSSTRD